MSPEREEHSYTNDDVAELLREKLKGLAKIHRFPDRFLIQLLFVGNQQDRTVSLFPKSNLP